LESKFGKHQSGQKLKAGAASEQELKLQVRMQRVLFTIAWKLLQKDRSAGN